MFLLTAISKMKEPKDGGSRIAIIHNGSPLFTGDAASGPSEIRKYILENDLLEAIIALPNDIFYNTGIATYIWVLSNKKAGTRREGKVQLINANGLYEKRRKALGNKRNDIPESAIQEITRLYGDFVESEISKIFDTADFGYTKITVEQPFRLHFSVTYKRMKKLFEEKDSLIPKFDALCQEMFPGKHLHPAIKEPKFIMRVLEICCGLEKEKRYKNIDDFQKDFTTTWREKTGATGDIDPAIIDIISLLFATHDKDADILRTTKGAPIANPDLRDTENVPLKEDIQTYFEREVLPFAPDAWIDEKKSKVGYEIPFTRYFYKYEAPKPSAEIMQEILAIEAELDGALAEVFGA